MAPHVGKRGAAFAIRYGIQLPQRCAIESVFHNPLTTHIAHLDGLRTSQPVGYDAATASWDVLRYHDVHAVLHDAVRFVVPAQPIANTMAHHFLDSRHYQIMRMGVNHVFHARSPLRLAVSIDAHVHAALERAQRTGMLDVIADLAAPVTLHTLLDVIGVPTQQRAPWAPWVAMVSTDAAIHDAHETALRPATTTTLQNMMAALHALVADDAVPAHTLLKVLRSSAVDSVRLTDDEIVVCCCWLLATSYAPAIHLLGNAALCVVTHRDVITRLQAPAPPIYRTIEEVLRYVPPISSATRRTTSTIILGDQHIPAGSIVRASIAAANRDPTHFHAAQRFDIDRMPNRHLCYRSNDMLALGMTIARYQASMVLVHLCTQFPDLRLARPTALERLPHPTLLGVARIPLVFVPHTHASAAHPANGA